MPLLQLDLTDVVFGVGHFFKMKIDMFASLELLLYLS